MQQMDLVIVESGAHDRSWHEMRPLEPPIVVLIQETCESPTQFAGRVSGRLGQLWGRGSRLRRVVLIGEDTFDVPTLGARLAMLREIRARDGKQRAPVPVALKFQ